MGVQLNIKDARTAELARELAQELNKTVTEVVREALEEKRQRRSEEIEELVADVRRISERAQELWNPATRHLSSKELMDAIYDENGLPA